jgi:hypothetical protein
VFFALSCLVVGSSTMCSTSASGRLITRRLCWNIFDNIIFDNFATKMIESYIIVSCKPKSKGIFIDIKARYCLFAHMETHANLTKHGNELGHLFQPMVRVLPQRPDGFLPGSRTSASSRTSWGIWME